MAKHWLFVLHQADSEAQPQSPALLSNALSLCCVVNSARNVIEVTMFEDAPSLLAVVDDERFKWPISSTDFDSFSQTQVRIAWGDWQKAAGTARGSSSVV